MSLPPIQADKLKTKQRSWTMTKLGRMAGVVMLAGAGCGMMKLCNEEGVGAGYVSAVEGSNETSQSEWVLPDPCHGLAPSRKQYLKLELDAMTDKGFVSLYWGAGSKPQFSLHIAGSRTLVCPAGAYPPAEFFEENDAPATVNWRAQIWPTSRLLRVVTREGEIRLPLEDPSLSNASWQNGLARLHVANASVTLYRLAGVDVPSLFIVR